MMPCPVEQKPYTVWLALAASGLRAIFCWSSRSGVAITCKPLPMGLLLLGRVLFAANGVLARRMGIARTWPLGVSGYTFGCCRNRRGALFIWLLHLPWAPMNLLWEGLGSNPVPVVWRIVHQRHSTWQSALGILRVPGLRAAPWHRDRLGYVVAHLL